MRAVRSAITATAELRVLDRLKYVDVRTSGRKHFGVQAPFAGRMPYFTVIRPKVAGLVP